jgi:hypothetical protein
MKPNCTQHNKEGTRKSSDERSQYLRNGNLSHYTTVLCNHHAYTCTAKTVCAQLFEENTNNANRLYNISRCTNTQQDFSQF